MIQKVKIQSVILKKETDKYKLYEVTLSDNRKASSFDAVLLDKQGQEVEVELTEKEYNGGKQLQISTIKQKKQFDFKSQNRRYAMEYAVSLVNNKSIEISKLSDYAERIYKWMENKND